jgi:hypothetical protein
MNFRRKQIRRNKPFHFDNGIAIRGKKKQKKICNGLSLRIWWDLVKKNIKNSVLSEINYHWLCFQLNIEQKVTKWWKNKGLKRKRRIVKKSASFVLYFSAIRLVFFVIKKWSLSIILFSLAIDQNLSVYLGFDRVGLSSKKSPQKKSNSSRKMIIHLVESNFKKTCSFKISKPVSILSHLFAGKYGC